MGIRSVLTGPSSGAHCTVNGNYFSMSMGGLTDRFVASASSNVRIRYTSEIRIFQGTAHSVRNLLILILLAFGAYKAYDYFAHPAIAAYDEAGNPNTLVFTFNGCPPCDNVMKLLAERHIKYTEYNISADAASAELMKTYGGGRQFPFIVTGSRTQAGFDRETLIGVLAEVHGPEVLTNAERKLLRHHFDAAGLPRVVMYSTRRCGYCKQARAYLEEKGIPIVERDIDRNAAAKRDFDALKGGGTPLIYVGFRRVPGFNKNRLNEALEIL